MKKKTLCAVWLAAAGFAFAAWPVKAPAYTPSDMSEDGPRAVLNTQRARSVREMVSDETVRTQNTVKEAKKLVRKYTGEDGRLNTVGLAKELESLNDPRLAAHVFAQVSINSYERFGTADIDYLVYKLRNTALLTAARNLVRSDAFWKAYQVGDKVKAAVQNAVKASVNGIVRAIPAIREANRLVAKFTVNGKLDLDGLAKALEKRGDAELAARVIVRAAIGAKTGVDTSLISRMSDIALLKEVRDLIKADCSFWDVYRTGHVHTSLAYAVKTALDMRIDQLGG